MTMVVECVGGAGVGKSHVARALVAELRARSIPACLAMAPVGPSTPKARRVARKVALALGEAVRSPGPSRRMATAVAMSGQQRGRDALAITLNWLTIRALVRRCRRVQGFHVFDQAALMSLWSTGLRGDASAGRALLERPEWCWVLPDAVLRVEASHEQTVVQSPRSGRASESTRGAGRWRAAGRAGAGRGRRGEPGRLVGDARADGCAPAVVPVCNSGDERLAQAIPELASQLLALDTNRIREGQVAP